MRAMGSPGKTMRIKRAIAAGHMGPCARSTMCRHANPRAMSGLPARPLELEEALHDASV